MTVEDYDTLLFERYIRILIVVTILWCGVNFRWYQDYSAASNTSHLIEVEEDRPELKIAEAKQVFAVPAFMSRIQKLHGAEIWAVSAEQHYILVQTDRGDELVLYRFSDAVRDLAELPGRQIHRSHWVSSMGVESFSKEGSVFNFVLKNGTKVPVSRSYKKDIEAWDFKKEASSQS